MKEFPKNFEAQKYEDGIYKLWEKSGFFNPDNLRLKKNAKTFTIILPPPNITDKLHLGHSSMLAIEDLIIRHRRMKGMRTLWLPGTDHASIATQNAVEKKLLKEKNLSRHDLGREKFLEEVWSFLKTTKATILTQARKMGSSLDWSREAFTLDDKRKKAVEKMFIEMYENGLIYRGKRIVNWCPRCHSTLSDDEVEYKTEKGKLYWLKYGPFVLATSRPETKLGDTAVAVYPGDKRYEKMVGKKYPIPGVLGDFEIVVIADRAVDPNFGSGAIKVTPAHDFTDNAIAKRHRLPMKQIIDENGRMMPNCGKYAGMKTDEAREAIVRDMEVLGLIDRIEENYEHNVAACYRCQSKIEPIPSEQWFVSVDKKIAKLGGKSLKEKALESARTKKIEFIPSKFEKHFETWIKNLQDWCISRQIWFGHEIPAYYKIKTKNEKLKSEKEEIYVGEKPPKGDGWIRDADTLDTWFSSGMWTFSTLGWPEKNNDLKNFHPTQVLETGYDILNLWVSRMIMMSLFALGEIPFEKVYLHGLVLDQFGKKMSKSKGNGIDPLDMIEKFGTDAVRLSLLIGTTPGNDMRIYEKKIEGYRNFVTKIWNIFRYAGTCDKMKLSEKIKKTDLKSLTDRWIVSRLEKIIEEAGQEIENYNFSRAGEILRKFTWDELADWYLEIHKIEKNNQVLGYVLDKILKLWHPFMPFITEKIWQEFSNKKNLLMVEKWPDPQKIFRNNKAENDFFDLMNLINRIRNIRSVYNISPSLILEIQGKKPENLNIIEKLARVKFSDSIELKKTIRFGKWKLAIHGLIDAEKEKERLTREIQSMEKSITQLKKLLANKNFLSSARKVIVRENKNRLKKYTSDIKIKKLAIKNLE